MNSSSSSWETVIGLEIHVQLNTVSKAFCTDEAKFSIAPNTQISAVSLAHPGTLPRPNARQLEAAVRLGLAIGSQINSASYFERKQYFYPDLPKGYQLSQQASPVCLGGQAEILTSKGIKTIRLHHIHMEEDAGKSVHDNDAVWTRIDLNRAGVPLLEIVTEPDFRNAEEVSLFLTDLQRLVRYLDISDGNMEEGSMRCDINVSVRPEGSEELRERCEIKNVNSRRFARKALEYEAKRQIVLWESGAAVVRQTMQFNPETGMTIPIRQKESAHDYRYFPDPDLPPLLISVKQLDQWRDSQPILPRQFYTILREEKSLPAEDVQVLIDLKETAWYYLELTHGHPALNKPAANWIIQTILPYLKEHQIKLLDLTINQDDLRNLLAAIESKKITVDQALQLWSKALGDPSVALHELLRVKLDSVSRLDPRQAISVVFDAFPEEALAFKGGKKKLIGFFLGEIKKRYPDCNIQEIQQSLAKT